MESDTGNLDLVAELREKMIEKFLILYDGDYKASKNTEISCYNATIKFADEKGFIKKWENPIFKNTYIHKCISVFTNLDPNSYIHNSKLIEKVRSGEIKAYEVGNLSSQELFPEHWQEIKEQKERKDKMTYEIRTEQIVRGLYKCKKCKGDKVSYYELQTRSADESTTLFITCCNCYYRWKNN